MYVVTTLDHINYLINKVTNIQFNLFPNFHFIRHFIRAFHIFGYGFGKLGVSIFQTSQRFFSFTD